MASATVIELRNKTDAAWANLFPTFGVRRVLLVQ